MDGGAAGPGGPRARRRGPAGGGRHAGGFARLLPRVVLAAAMLAAGAVPPAPAQGRPWLSADERLADFDQLWEFVRDRYAYFAEKATDWDAVRERYRPLAAAAPDRAAFVSVLEATLDELYDPHTHLGTNLASSWRLPPHDVWVEPRAGGAAVAQVRRGSAAERAGLEAGMTVVAIDGVPVGRAGAERRPKALRRPDAEADAWALRTLAAGRHDRARDFAVVDRTGRERHVRVEEGPDRAGEPPVSFRMLPGNVGYVRIATFGDEAAVAEFDRALEGLRGARALVIDVRDNPGGDTEVARPIMGRLIDRRMQYAWMARRDGPALGPRWAEYVDPRGPWTYRGPVAVLVDHFSESMAEGFAMGLDGMGRATVVGTTMAGLGAGIARTTLSKSGIGAQVSAEPVYHVGGAPRTAFAPKVLVDLAAARGARDPILAAALRHLGGVRGRHNGATRTKSSRRPVP